jgi:hypothetical protein
VAAAAPGSIKSIDPWIGMEWKSRSGRTVGISSGGGEARRTEWKEEEDFGCSQRRATTEACAALTRDG